MNKRYVFFISTLLSLVFLIRPLDVSAAITSLNGLNGTTQSLATTTGASTMHMKIISSGSTHTFQWDNTPWSISQGGTGTTTLSNGFLLFPQSGILSQSNNLFWNPSTNYLGIGTSNPQARVDVSGSMYSRLHTVTGSTVNWDNGNVQTLTLTSNTTLTFTNGQAGGEYKLILRQDSSAGRTVSWPSSVLWPGDGTPILSTTTLASDVISFIFDGTNYLGSYNLNYHTTSGLSLDSGLVSYYKMSGNSNDSVNTNNGSDTSVTYSNSYGIIGNGANYGTLSETVVADNASLDFTSALTIAGWIKPQNFSGTATNNLVVKYKDSSWSSGNGGQWYLRVNTANEIEGGINIGGAIQGITASASFSTSTYAFVAMTYDGSAVKIYVNGSLVANSSLSGALATGSNPMYIGNNTPAGDTSSQYVDELGIWNRALSSSEISSLYNGGSGLQYPF